MAKVLTTTFRILGELDGSFMSAVRQANGVMAGLRRALTGQARFKGLDDLPKKLNELRQASAALERFKQMSRGGLVGGLDQLKAAQNEVLRLKTALQTARDAGQKTLARTLESQLKVAERNVTKAFTGYGAQASELKALYGALSAAGIKVRDLASAESQLKSALAGANEAMRLQENFSRAYNAQSNASSDLNTAWGNMQSAVSTAGAIMSPFKAATDNAETFEHAMSRVKSLTQSANIREGNFDKVRAEMAELEAQARELGATTQFTMTQAAQAQGFLGMAGWSKDQIVKAMPGMLDLAAASGMDLARTADIVSDNLTALGMTADQVGHMTDVYAYALTRSNLNMEALGESMKYAAPAMHAYGGDIHDAAAAMMIMGNAGIKGSMAGTALRMGLLRLAGPPKKATKEMESLGISLSDATRMAYESQAQLESLGIHMDDSMPPMEKMKFVLEELDDKMRGLSKDEKLAAVGAIFGVNAASGWLSILEQGPEQFQKFRDELRDADGTAKQVAVTMNDDTRGSWLYLESAIDALSNNIGTAFLPMLRGAYDALNPIVTAMAQWAGQSPRVIQGIGGIAAAIATAVVGLSAFRLVLAGISFASTTIELMKATAALRALSGAGSLLGGLTGKIAGLGRALSMLAGPWGLAIAAGVGLIIANWDTLVPYFESLWSKIGGIFESASTKLKPALDWFMKPIEDAALKEKQSASRAELSKGVEGALKIEGNDLDELTRTTRGILRATEGKSDEEIGAEILAQFGNQKQTDAAQLQQKEILRAELENRSDISESSKEAITKYVNDGLYEMKVGSVDAIRDVLSEGLGKFDLSKGAERMTALSTAKDVLNVTGGLSTTEKAGLLDEITVKVENEGKTLELQSAFTNALENQSMKTHADQMTALNKMIEVSSKSEADLSIQRSSIERFIEGNKDLTLTAQAEMKATLGEILQARSDEKYGAQFDAILKASTSESERAAGLIEALKAGGDHSAEAIREAIATLKTEGKKAGLDDAALASLTSAVESGMKSATSEIASTRAKETWERTSEQPAIPTVHELMPASPMSGTQSWQNLSPSLGATQTVDYGNGIWSALSDLIFSRSEGAAAPENQTLNVEGVQAAADQLASAVTNAGAGVEGLSASTQSAGAGVTMFGEMASASGALVQNLGVSSEMAAASASAAGASIDGLSASSAGATAGIDGLGAASSGAQAGVGSLGEAAGGASGSVSGLGAAASSAIGALMSAASSAGAAISGALSSASAAISSFISPSISSNAVGGIYPRGAFVTTFAEESPEAAIPIEKTKRSVGLWQKVGEMIGILPKDEKKEKAEPRPSLAGVPSNVPIQAGRKTGGAKPSILSAPKVSLPFGLTIPDLFPHSPGAKKRKESESKEPAESSTRYPGVPSNVPMPKPVTDKIPTPSLPSPSIMSAPRLPLPPWLTKPLSKPPILTSKMAEYDETASAYENARANEASTPQSAGGDIPAINISLTFNGATNREDVEGAIPSIRENLEEALERFKHEQARRSYA